MIYRIKQKKSLPGFLIKIKLLLITVVLTMGNNLVKGQSIYQNYIDSESYVIVQKIDGYVYLYKRDGGSTVWVEVGNTSRTDIRSICLHPVDNTIYAVSGGQLGVLSEVDGSFSVIGPIGSGDGERGNVVFDNIFAITYSYQEDVIYATHRIESDYIIDNELLIKIDSKSGTSTNGGFIDSNDNPADYTVIQSVALHANYAHNNFVTDIATNPFDGTVYIIATEGVKSPIFDDYEGNVLSVINNQNGEIESVFAEFDDSYTGFSFDQFAYTDNTLYLLSEANFEDASNPIESYISYTDQAGVTSISIFDAPAPGSSVLDFDYVKSSCQQNLVIAENGSTGYQIPPLQQSSETIVTEQTSDPASWDVIVAYQTLDFKSGHITLQPGFHVLDNACFNAVIEPCE